MPADPLRNLAPASARVEVVVVRAATGEAVSNPLVATITEFPRFRGDPTALDDKPFGWGKPLADAGPAPLPTASPDGLHFVRISANGPDAPGFFLAQAEVTNSELAAHLPGYDPKAGRSDEFNLEAGDQPAVGLTPARAREFLKALGTHDPAGAAYRLPTAAEWTRAANGGQPSAFWWGDDATYDKGANLIGAEPALAADATAPSVPPEGVEPNYVANPYGLFHTYGNVAEWAGNPDGTFARMGGHFRTEPATPLPPQNVAKDDEVGPDPFVGVRPALDLTPPVVEAIARKRLDAADPKLAKVQASYNPDRATITLTGDLDDPSTRRKADRALEGLWFVAAVDNQVASPRPFPGQLATLAASPEPGKVDAVLDRSFLDVPVNVRWFDPLPVIGSHWWVNIYLPTGEHLYHKLTETEAGRTPRAIVSVDRARLRDRNLPDGTAFSVALSLGEPAPTPGDPHVVTNVLQVKPVLRKPTFR